MLTLSGNNSIGNHKLISEFRLIDNKSIRVIFSKHCSIIADFRYKTLMKTLRFSIVLRLSLLIIFVPLIITVRSMT